MIDSAGSIESDRSYNRYIFKPPCSELRNRAAPRLSLRLGMSLAQWVTAALKHADISAAELARRMSEKLGRHIDRAAVNKMMKTTASARTKPRRVSGDEMMAIAEITGFAPPSSARLDLRGVAPGTKARGVPVVGEVAAGVWIEPDDLDAQAPRVQGLFISPDSRFAFDVQRAYVVRGRSIEQWAKDGEALVCVLISEGVEPKDGDIVIVERRRHQGGLIERTAKLLRIYRTRAELVPQYYDDALNEPLDLGHLEDGDEIRIVAKAIGAYRPFGL